MAHVHSRVAPSADDFDFSAWIDFSLAERDPCKQSSINNWPPTQPASVDNPGGSTPDENVPSSMFFFAEHQAPLTVFSRNSQSFVSLLFYLDSIPRISHGLYRFRSQTNNDGAQENRRHLVYYHYSNSRHVPRVGFPSPEGDVVGGPPPLQAARNGASAGGTRRTY
jgi:hypothetical protein